MTTDETLLALGAVAFCVLAALAGAGAAGFAVGLWRTLRR